MSVLVADVAGRHPACDFNLRAQAMQTNMPVQRCLRHGVRRPTAVLAKEGPTDSSRNDPNERPKRGRRFQRSMREKQPRERYVVARVRQKRTRPVDDGDPLRINQQIERMKVTVVE